MGARGATTAVAVICMLAVGLPVAAAEGDGMPDQPPLVQTSEQQAEAPTEEPVDESELPETPFEDATADKAIELANDDEPEGYDPDTSVEIVEERRETSKTFLNADGSETTQSSLLPMHWWDDDRWVDIDTSLSETEPGVFVSGSNAWTAEFRPLPDGLTIRTDDGPISFQPMGANDVTPVRHTDDDSVIYPNAWDDVDLVYVVTPEGVKEDLILHAPPDQTHFDFLTEEGRFTYEDGVLTPGGDPQLGELRSAEILDRDGSPLEDGRASIMSIAWPDDSPRVSIRFDADELAAVDPDRYPLSLDPTWTADGSAYVANYKSDIGEYCSPCGPHIRIGNPAQPGTPRYWRTVAWFLYDQALGRHVTNATLSISNRHYGTSSSYPMNVYWASSWSYAGARRGSPLASGNIGSSRSFNLTSFYREHAANNNRWAALGFTGYEVSGWTYKAFKDFRLSITSVPKVTTPLLVSPSNGAAVGTSNPRFTVRNLDSRSAYLAIVAYDANGRQVHWQWCGGNSPRMTAPNANCSWNLSFPTEGVYTWRAAAAVTNPWLWSENTPTRSLTVDHRGPDITNVTGWPSGVNDGWRPWGWNWVLFDATDVSGVNGISYAWTQSAYTWPDTIADSRVCAHSSWDYYVQVPNFTADCSYQPPEAADGTWWFHARARNRAGVWGPPIHVRHQFDRTPPTAPSLTNTCPSAPDADPQVTVTWDPSTDETSGVRGYSWVWNQSATTPPDTTTIEGDASARSATSPPLTDGDWWFHLVGLDNALHWNGSNTYPSEEQVLGPIKVRNGEITEMPEGDDDFQARWLPRINDLEFMDDYLSSPVIPLDVLVEGYHTGLDEQTQRALATCLVRQQLTETNPDVFGEDGLFEQLADLYWTLIFDPGNAPPMPVEEPVIGLIEGLTPYAEDIVSVVDEAVDDLPTVEQVLADPVGAITSPPVVGGLTPDVLGTLEGVPDVVASLVSGELVGLAAGTAIGAAELASDEIRRVGDEAGVGEITDPVLDTLQQVIDANTYSLCWESQNGDTGCVHDLPNLVPASYDITGDGTMDIQASVTFLPLPTAPQASFEVDRLSTSEFAGQPLRSHVWIVYDVTPTERLRLGYDGLHDTAGLSETTTTTIVADTAALADGDLVAELDVEHVDPESSWAMTVQRSTVVGTGTVEEVDPLAVQVRFTPVPTIVSGNVTLQSSSTGGDTDGELAVAFDSSQVSTTRVLASTSSTSDGTTSTRLTEVDIQDMPSSLDLSVEAALRAQGADTLRAEVTTSTAVGRIDVRQASRADASVPGDVDHAALVIEDVPTSIVVEGSLDDGASSVTATSSSRVTRIGLGLASYESDALVRGGSADVFGVPTEMTASMQGSADGSLGALYEADGEIDAITVAGRDVPLDLSVQGHVLGIPGRLEVTSAGATTDLSLEASGGVDEIAFVATLGGDKAIVPAEDHATVLFEDGGVGASFKVTGFERVRLGLADNGDVVGELRMTPGGNDIVLAAVAADLGLGVVRIDDLPADLQLSFQPGQKLVHHVASGPVTSIQGYATLFDTGPSAYLGVHDIPADIRLQVHDDPTWIDVDASQPLGLVEAWFSPDDVDTLDLADDRYVHAGIGSIPGAIDLVIDVPGKHVEWQADGPVSDIVVAARGLLSSLPDAAAMFAVAEVPAHWFVDWNDDVVASTPVGVLGPTSLAVTSDGTVHVPGGAHASLVASTSPLRADVSVLLPGIEEVVYAPRPNGMTLIADTDLDGDPFTLHTDLRVPADGASSVDEIGISGYASFFDVPERVDLFVADPDDEEADKDAFTIIADSSLKAEVDLVAGWIDAWADTGEPVLYHGVSVSDGACEAGPTCRPATDLLCNDDRCFAARARALITQAPTEVRWAPRIGTVNVIGIADTAASDHFTVRAVVDDVLPGDTAVDVAATLDGIQSPTDVYVTAMELESKPNEPVRSYVAMDNTAAVGGFHLDGKILDLGDSIELPGEVRIDSAIVCASLVPIPAEASFVLDVAHAVDEDGDGDEDDRGDVVSTTVSGVMSSPIDHLVARVDTPDQTCGAARRPTDVLAQVQLTDVPSEFALRMVPPPKEATYGAEFLMPRVDYRANGDTLSGLAVVSDELLSVVFDGQFGRDEVDPDAAGAFLGRVGGFEFGFEDMGGTTSIDVLQPCKRPGEDTPQDPAGCAPECDPNADVEDGEEPCEPACGPNDGPDCVEPSAIAERKTLQVSSDPPTGALWAGVGAQLLLTADIAPERMDLPGGVADLEIVLNVDVAYVGADAVLEIEDIANLQVSVSETFAAMGVDGQFGSFDFGLAEFDSYLNLDGHVKVRRFKQSGLYPFFNYEFDLQGRYDDLLFNVMGTPWGPGGPGTENPREAHPEKTACLRFALGPIPIPFGSASLHTSPALDTYGINGVHIDGVLRDPDARRPWVIGYMNPLTDEGNGRYRPALDPDLLNVGTSQLSPFKDVQLPAPKIKPEVHDSTTC